MKLWYQYFLVAFLFILHGFVGSHVALTSESLTIHYNEILAVDSSTVYATDGYSTIVFDIFSEKAFKAEFGKHETGKLTVGRDGVYGLKGDSLRLYTPDLSELKYQYLHHEAILGVAGESENETNIISSSGLYVVDRTTSSVMRHVEIDSVIRYERALGLGYVFTQHHRLLRLNEENHSLEFLGSCLPVDSASYIAVSDSILCIGNLGSVYEENELEYWDLVKDEKIEVEVYLNKGMPLAASGSVVFKGHNYYDVAELDYETIYATRITSKNREIATIYNMGFGTLHDATVKDIVDIFGVVVGVGDHSHITTFNRKNYETNTMSLLQPSPYSLVRFDSEFEGMVTGEDLLVSYTKNGGLTWRPWHIERDLYSRSHGIILDYTINSNDQLVAYTPQRTFIGNVQQGFFERIDHVSHVNFPTVMLPTGLFVRCDTAIESHCTLSVSDNAVDFQRAFEIDLDRWERCVVPYVRNDTVFLVTEKRRNDPSEYFRLSITNGELVAREFIGVGRDVHVVQKDNSQLFVSIASLHGESILLREDLVTHESTSIRLPVDSLYVMDVLYSSDTWLILDDESWLNNSNDGARIIRYEVETGATTIQRYSGLWLGKEAQFVSDSMVVSSSTIGPFTFTIDEHTSVVTSIPAGTGAAQFEVVRIMQHGRNTLHVEISKPEDCYAESVELVRLDGGFVPNNAPLLSQNSTGLHVQVNTRYLPSGKYFIAIVDQDGTTLHVPIVVEH